MDSPGVNPEPPPPPRRPLHWPVQFLRRRLSPGEDLGLHLTIGILVMILGCWGFSEIANEIGPNRDLAMLDQRATQWFQQRASSSLTDVAFAISYLGSVVALTTFSIVCALLLISVRAWERLLGLALTMLGGSVLNILLKHFFQRERPVFEDPLVTLASFSFPSGHAMGATLLFGFLALLLAHLTSRWHWQLLITIAAVLLIAAISATRIYLGAHYLTDVLAAIAIGSAWLAFSWTTAETFRRHRKSAARTADAGASG